MKIFGKEQNVLFLMNGNTMEFSDILKQLWHSSYANAQSDSKVHVFVGNQGISVYHRFTTVNVIMDLKMKKHFYRVS